MRALAVRDGHLDSLRRDVVFSQHIWLLPGGECLRVFQVGEELPSDFGEVGFVADAVVVGNAQKKFVAAVVDGHPINGRLELVELGL